MNIVSLFKSSSTLGVPWEANMPFEILGAYIGQHYIRGIKINLSVKKLYFFRRLWLIQTLRGRLKEEFYPEDFFRGVL